MAQMQTNRDLYLAIAQLCECERPNVRVLEQYLCALLELAEKYEASDTISLDEFYSLIAGAFSQPPTPLREAWLGQYDNFPVNAAGFKGFAATIKRQIVDLHEMAAAGTLTDKYRDFGMSAPRGSQWYNFDPCTFVECAMAGALGGWEPDDQTGRQYVPGEVAVADESGELQTMKPEKIPRPVVHITRLSWDQIKDFIECGQLYE